MGSGPEHLLAAGLPDAMATSDRPVRTAVVDLGDIYPSENLSAFEAIERVGRRARSNLAAGRFTFLLSGNCNAMVGLLAGSANGPADPLGLLWLDSHPDFETPESTLHGSLDSMGLAMATGACWRARLEAMPGFAPIEERHTILVGGRQTTPSEKARLERSAVSVVPEREVRGRAFTSALDSLVGAVARIHVHVDLDVLDQDEVGSANEYASRGGLLVEDVLWCVQQVRERFALATASFASYDPSGDDDGRVKDGARRCATAIVGQP